MREIHLQAAKRLKANSIVPGLVCLRLARGNDAMTQAAHEAAKIFWMAVLRNHFMPQMSVLTVNCKMSVLQ